jgi:hypothetical protein
MTGSGPSHFIVKHGLDSLKALPNYIWRTDKGPNELPRSFDQVKPGDRWIAFVFHARGMSDCTLSPADGSHPLCGSAERAVAAAKRCWMIGIQQSLNVNHQR